MMNENLEYPLFIAPSKPARQLHPLVLAYIGDAVYEMYIRQYLLTFNNHKPHHLHKQSINFVSAKAQCRYLQVWMPLLTEEEKEVVKRGRNAKSGSVPRNADILEYRHSTAFECLVGYLYYEKRLERLQQLFLTIINPKTEVEE